MFLRGATESIEQFRPIILLELHFTLVAQFGTTPREVIDWLRQSRYLLYTITAGWIRPILVPFAELPIDKNRLLVSRLPRKHYERSAQAL